MAVELRSHDEYARDSGRSPGEQLPNTTAAQPNPVLRTAGDGMTQMLAEDSFFATCMTHGDRNVIECSGWS